MLAEARRRIVDGPDRKRQPIGRAGKAQALAQGWMIDLREEAAVNELRVFGQVPDTADRRHHDLALERFLAHLFASLADDEAFEDAAKLGLIECGRGLGTTHPIGLA